MGSSDSEGFGLESCLSLPLAINKALRGQVDVWAATGVPTSQPPKVRRRAVTMSQPMFQKQNEGKTQEIARLQRKVAELTNKQYFSFCPKEDFEALQAKFTELEQQRDQLQRQVAGAQPGVKLTVPSPSPVTPLHSPKAPSAAEAEAESSRLREALGQKAAEVLEHRQQNQQLQQQQQAAQDSIAERGKEAA